MSASIPVGRTPSSAQLGAGALQLVLGGCRMSPPLPWLGQPVARHSPASQCSLRLRDGRVTCMQGSRFPPFIFNAHLVTVNGTGSQIWAFVSDCFFFFSCLCFALVLSALSGSPTNAILLSLLRSWGTGGHPRVPKGFGGTGAPGTVVLGTPVGPRLVADVTSTGQGHAQHTRVACMPAPLGPSPTGAGGDPWVLQQALLWASGTVQSREARELGGGFYCPR